MTWISEWSFLTHCDVHPHFCTKARPQRHCNQVSSVYFTRHKLPKDVDLCGFYFLYKVDIYMQKERRLCFLIFLSTVSPVSPVSHLPFSLPFSSSCIFLHLFYYPHFFLCSSFLLHPECLLNRLLFHNFVCLFFCISVLIGCKNFRNAEGIVINLILQNFKKTLKPPYMSVFCEYVHFLLHPVWR